MSCDGKQDNKVMNMDERIIESTSPLVDTFELADDVLIPYRTRDSLFGYINKNGEWAIKPQWPMAFPFANGRAAVMKVINDWQNAVAMIDRTGKLVTDFIYTNIAPSGYPGHWQVALLGGQWGIIDSLGNEIIPAGYHAMGLEKESGWYLVRINGYDGPYGYVAPDGKIILKPEYDDLVFHNGYIKFKTDGKYGFMNKELKVIIPAEYEFANTIGPAGLAHVVKNGERYMMNAKGEEVINLRKYDDINYTHEKIGIVRTGSYPNKKYGLIDLKTGEEILAPSLYSISSFYNGFAPASIKPDNSRFRIMGIINEKGEFTVDPIYSHISYYGNGRFHASLPEEKMATKLIDGTGKVIVDSEYYISSFDDYESEPFYRLENFEPEPNQMGVIDLNGNMVLPIRYTETSDDAFDENGLMQVKKDGIYYFVDMKGREYIEKE